MSLPATNTSHDGRRWRYLSAGCLFVALAAWLVTIVRDHSVAGKLNDGPAIALDALLIVGFAGAVLLRFRSYQTNTAAWTFVFRILLVVLATSLSVACGEFALRFEFRHARTSGNAGDYIGRNSTWDPGPPNRLGFREREIPPKSSKYRIAVIGDSFTWGQGLERSERFTDVMQATLGSGYEVFNFAVPGDNMPEHLIRLDNALTVSPDFILLELYINDFETADMVRPTPYVLLPMPLHEQLIQMSLTYTLLQDQFEHIQELLGMTESYPHYMARNLLDPESPHARKAFGQLQEFFDRARRAGVPAGAVLFPATDVLGRHGADYPFEYLHRAVQATCSEAWVPCLDLLPMFSQFADPHVAWVSPFDAHPNAMANRLAADEILRSFESMWRP